MVFNATMFHLPSFSKIDSKNAATLLVSGVFYE